MVQVIEVSLILQKQNNWFMSINFNIAIALHSASSKTKSKLVPKFGYKFYIYDIIVFNISFWGRIDRFEKILNIWAFFKWGDEKSKHNFNVYVDLVRIFHLIIVKFVVIDESPWILARYKDLIN